MLDHLAALVDKSLVQSDDIRGSTRYRLLETVRHYAGERLACRRGPELNQTRAAYRDFYLALVETADLHLRDRTRPCGSTGFRPNSTTSGARWRSASPIRTVPSPAWTGCGAALVLHHARPRRRSPPGAQRPAPAARRPTAHPGPGRALTASCHLRERFGEDSAVPSMAGEALRIARDLAYDAVAADALSQLCWFRFEHGDLPAALAQIGEAVALAQGGRRSPAACSPCRPSCGVRGPNGRSDAAFADQKEALTLSRAAGDNYRLAATLANLGIDQLAARELPRPGLIFGKRA